MKKELTAWQKFKKLPWTQKVKLVGVFSLLLVLLLLVLTALVMSLAEPAPILFENPLRRELIQGKAQRISFFCDAIGDTGKRVTVEVQFTGFKDKKTAMVNNLAVVTGYQLNVNPRECTNYYKVGVIEIQRSRVFLHAVPPQPITPPFETQ